MVEDAVVVKEEAKEITTVLNDTHKKFLHDNYFKDSNYKLQEKEAPNWLIKAISRKHDMAGDAIRKCFDDFRTSKKKIAIRVRRGKGQKTTDIPGAPGIEVSNVDLTEAMDDGEADEESVPGAEAGESQEADESSAQAVPEKSAEEKMPPPALPVAVKKVTKAVQCKIARQITKGTQADIVNVAAKNKEDALKAELADLKKVVMPFLNTMNALSIGQPKMPICTFWESYGILKDQLDPVDAAEIRSQYRHSGNKQTSVASSEVDYAESSTHEQRDANYMDLDDLGDLDEDKLQSYCDTNGFHLSFPSSSNPQYEHIEMTSKYETLGYAAAEGLACLGNEVGSEISIERVPKRFDCYDILTLMQDKCGNRVVLTELRMTTRKRGRENASWLNVCFKTKAQAKYVVRMLDEYEVVPQLRIRVRHMPTNNRVLHFSSIETNTEESIMMRALSKLTLGVAKVYVRPDEPWSNVTYLTHKDAAIARRFFRQPDAPKLLERAVLVDWASAGEREMEAAAVPIVKREVPIKMEAMIENHGQAIKQRQEERQREQATINDWPLQKEESLDQYAKSKGMKVQYDTAGRRVLGRSVVTLDRTANPERDAIICIHKIPHGFDEEQMLELVLMLGGIYSLQYNYDDTGLFEGACTVEFLELRVAVHAAKEFHNYEVQTGIYLRAFEKRAQTQLEISDQTIYKLTPEKAKAKVAADSQGVISAAKSTVPGRKATVITYSSEYLSKQALTALESRGYNVKRLIPVPEGCEPHPEEVKEQTVVKRSASPPPESSSKRQKTNPDKTNGFSDYAWGSKSDKSTRGRSRW